jgi:5-methyltetrahydropteroyltriglutamate--homocysteine methyltransferase
MLETTLVGSYPQPGWLIDRDALRARVPARVRADELWRVDAERLREAQDDAVLLAIRDQERAGLDVITDGEARRESYSNRFATALGGIDVDHFGTVLNRTGQPLPVPRVVGPIERRAPVLIDDLAFLRAHTERAVKMTIPGPFTMAQQAQDDHYGSEEELAFAYADVVRAEVADLFRAGADVVQLDEPWMEARPEQARRYGLATLERALDGIEGTTALHICFGYPGFVPGRPPAYHFLTELAASPVDQISIETAQSQLDLAVLEALGDKTIVLGVIALDTEEVESADTVAQRIRRALGHVAPDRLLVAPDCGMKYLDRAAASAKLEAMVAGARRVRDELGVAPGAQAPG